MKILLCSCLITGLIWFSSCSKDEAEENTMMCITTNLSYTNAIASILNTNCALSGCHVNGGDAFSLSTYDDAALAVSAGRIIGAINHQQGFEAMPRPIGSPKLDQCTIDKITSWINNGAPE